MVQDQQEAISGPATGSAGESISGKCKIKQTHAHITANS